MLLISGNLLQNLVHCITSNCGFLGSTWTLEMVWCIMNNLDFEAARSTLINFRSPIIE